MNVYYTLEEFSAPNAVVSVGTFDGLHKGHYKILQALRQHAERINGECVIVTFWPHPRMVLNPNDTNLKLLNVLEEKISRFKESGIKHLVLMEFTREFAALTAQEFIEKVLVKQINAKVLVVGYDHHFGRNREGNIDNLRKILEPHHVEVDRVEALGLGDTNISSTKIRHALESGDVELAATYLGYEYFIRGTVVEGRKFGRTVSFPTANVHIAEQYKLVPASGVYTVSVEHQGNQYKGMLNIGLRPTIEEPDKQQRIEVHILDFDKQVYDQKLKLTFHKRLRNEMKFASIDQLVQQLHADKQATKAFFKIQ